VAQRKDLFAGASHDYVSQRVIVDCIAEEALPLAAGNVVSGLAANWRKWLHVPTPVAP
jgi:hypothetical protein